MVAVHEIASDSLSIQADQEKILHVLVRSNVGDTDGIRIKGPNLEKVLIYKVAENIDWLTVPAGCKSHSIYVDERVFEYFEFRQLAEWVGENSLEDVNQIMIPEAKKVSSLVFIMPAAKLICEIPKKLEDWDPFLNLVVEISDERVTCLPCYNFMRKVQFITFPIGKKHMSEITVPKMENLNTLIITGAKNVNELLIRSKNLPKIKTIIAHCGNVVFEGNFPHLIKVDTNSKIDVDYMRRVAPCIKTLGGNEFKLKSPEGIRSIEFKTGAVRNT